MSWRIWAMGVGLGLIAFGLTDCRAKPSDPLTKHEVVLGDGTKATCVVVQGERAAGVTCVPHIVLGPDAEEYKP
jgi:hypothetical protein